MLVFFEHLQLTFYRMCCYFNLKKTLNLIASDFSK